MNVLLFQQIQNFAQRLTGIICSNLVHRFSESTSNTCPKEQTCYYNESIQDNEKQINVGNTELNHVTIESNIQFIKFVRTSSSQLCFSRPHRIDCTEIIFNLSYLLSFSVSNLIPMAT